jgi:hypothetical protein
VDPCFELRFGVIKFFVTGTGVIIPFVQAMDKVHWNKHVLTLHKVDMLCLKLYTLHVVTIWIYTESLKNVFWRYICELQASKPQIPFQNSILCSSAHCFLVWDTRAFFYLGMICRFSWNGANVSHWRFLDNRHMNTSADFQNSKFYQFRLNVKFWLSRC